MIAKPFSQACENNKGPILEVLQQHLEQPGRLLEVGSGTGQHAAFFGPRLPHIQWQPSDVGANLPGIRLWLKGTPRNVSDPLTLDVDARWPAVAFDYLFTANTLHIMRRDTVLRFLAKGARHLRPNGLFLIYGPFNYHGAYTSEGNRDFDAALRSRDPETGIRDQEWVTARLAEKGLDLIADHAMPANNHLLVYRRSGAPQSAQ